MYPLNASDTFCGGDAAYTLRIIGWMKDTWQDRVRRKMAELQLTQAHLMPVFGVTTRGAVGHYLKGRRTPTPQQMLALARRLGMSLDELQAGSITGDEVTHVHDANDVLAIQMLLRSLITALTANAPSAAEDFSALLREQADQRGFSVEAGLLAEVLRTVERGQRSAANAAQRASQPASVRQSK